MHVGTEQTPLTIRRTCSSATAARSGTRPTPPAQTSPGSASCCRSASPVARGSAARCGADSRPEYYDFDLFRALETTGTLADRRLAELSYTVFDTETTGARAFGGRRDHLHRRGAHRERPAAQARGLRAARRSAALRAARFDAHPRHRQPRPRRAADARARCCPASTASARTRCWSRTTRPSTCASSSSRKPRPACVSRSRCSTRCCFRPSCIPSSQNHSLEAIAERLGVRVIGRHTALGDALVTGEIFLKLLPLLAERGIVDAARRRSTLRARPTMRACSTDRRHLDDRSRQPARAPPRRRAAGARAAAARARAPPAGRLRRAQHGERGA